MGLCGRRIVQLDRRRMSDVVIFTVLLLMCLDLPTHLVDGRRQIFLPRGMLGRVDCPVDANPPVTLTVWTKDERVIDVTRTTRFKIQADGTLLIKPVASADEGRYSCTPYSSLGAGQTSPSIDVVVRGTVLGISPTKHRTGPHRMSGGVRCGVSSDPLLKLFFYYTTLLCYTALRVVYIRLLRDS